MAEAAAEDRMKLVRRERADCFGVEFVGPCVRPHIGDDRIERGLGVPRGGHEGAVSDGNEDIGPIARSLDGEIADQRTGGLSNRP